MRHLKIALLEDALRRDPLAAESELGEELTSDEPELRRAAAKLLGRLESATSLERLRDALEDPSPFVAGGVIEALAARGAGEPAALLSARMAPPTATPTLEARVEAALGGDCDALFQLRLRRVDEGSLDRLARLLGRDSWVVRGTTAPNDATRRDAFGALIDAAAIVVRSTHAFERVAPLLEPSELGDSFGKDRADFLLLELERTLAESSADDTPAPLRSKLDPRFLAIAKRLTQVPELTRPARELVSGFAWLERPDVDPLAKVDLPTAEDEPRPFFTAEPFPLLVAGVRVDHLADVGVGNLTDAVRALPEKPPAGFSLFDHQYAGASTLAASLLGFGIRCPPELTTTLAASLDASAREQLATWNGTLQRAFPLPDFTSVEEAFAESGPCDLLRWLNGLPVLGFRARLRPWRGVHFFGDPEVQTIGQFGDAEASALRDFAGALTLRPRPLSAVGQQRLELELRPQRLPSNDDLRRALQERLRGVLPVGQARHDLSGRCEPLGNAGDNLGEHRPRMVEILAHAERNLRGG